jgi:molybdate/tungstate transport system substrate-binding protein
MLLKKRTTNSGKKHYPPNKMKHRGKYASWSVLAIVLSVAFMSCTQSTKNPEKKNNAELQGELIIFHAGSLSAPMKQISQDFGAKYPGVRVLLEAAGSVDCARKITELKKPCDLMASSDYKVIENFLIPEYSGWHIPFAANEMVIAFTEQSKKAGEINRYNWTDLLLSDEIRYGRADPASDPCGYRTCMVFDLTAKYLDSRGLAEKFKSKDNRFIRPKEVDLLALLDVNEVDYIFIYRSVAIQHHLKYLVLPDEINLKNPALAGLYNEVSVKIPGNKPGDSVVIAGEAMVYSITMLNDAPHKEAAMAFLEFMLGAGSGMKIIEGMGQKSVIPSESSYYSEVPEPLKKFVTN